MSLIKIIVLAVLVIFSSFSFSQLNSESLTSSKDSYSTSFNPSNNFGTSTYLYSGTFSLMGNYYYRRSYVDFDLASLSIPSNAVIYSATLNLKKETDWGGNNWEARLVLGNWVEDSISLNNEPALGSNSNEICTTYVEDANSLSFDVKNHVQKMVYGSLTGFGWSIQVEDETVQSLTGAKFYSKEETTASLRPELIIEWYSPISLSNVGITHESGNNAADGTISFTVDGGASTSNNYSWIDGATGNSIGSNSSSISGLGYGWYGVHITGSYGEELFQAFLVGKECNIVSIPFKINGDYSSNAKVQNNSFASIDFKDYNFGNFGSIVSSEIYGGAGGQGTSNSLLKFNLWFDNQINIKAADLKLLGENHDFTNGNAVKSSLINVDWNEDLVTWNKKPSINSTVTVDFGETSSSNENKTIDIMEYCNAWKANNSSNYGFYIEESILDNDANSQVYFSPNSSDPNSIPEVEFRVLVNGSNCGPLYAKLKYELDGYYYTMNDGLIRFVFNQEYGNSILKFNIYNNSGYILKNESDFGIQAISYGDNYITIDVSDELHCLESGFYYLEVINDKKEKSYLRFHIQNNPCSAPPPPVGE